MGTVQLAIEPDLDADYVEAPAIAKVAQDLIARHPRFRPLLAVRIAYMERLGEPTGDGENVLAKCQRFGPLPRDTSGIDVVIWVWRAVWNGLSERQREALVAHELCHPFVTETGKVKLVPHDLEEFAWVVRQYGPWKEDIRHFGHQLTAFEREDLGADEAVDRIPADDEPVRLPAGRERRRPRTRKPPVVTP